MSGLLAEDGEFPGEPVSRRYRVGAAPDEIGFAAELAPAGGAGDEILRAVDVAPVILVLVLDMRRRLGAVVGNAVANEGAGRGGDEIQQVLDLFARTARRLGL